LNALLNSNVYENLGHENALKYLSRLLGLLSSSLKGGIALPESLDQLAITSLIVMQLAQLVTFLV